MAKNDIFFQGAVGQHRTLGSAISVYNQKYPVLAVNKIIEHLRRPDLFVIFANTEMPI